MYCHCASRRANEFLNSRALRFCLCVCLFRGTLTKDHIARYLELCPKLQTITIIHARFNIMFNPHLLHHLSTIFQSSNLTSFNIHSNINVSMQFDIYKSISNCFSHLIHLSLSRLNFQMMKHLTTIQMNNLQSFQFNQCELHQSFCNKLIPSHNLQSLSLQRCELNDLHCKFIGALPNSITNLNVSVSWQLTSKGLKRLLPQMLKSFQFSSSILASDIFQLKSLNIMSTPEAISW